MESDSPVQPEESALQAGGDADPAAAGAFAVWARRRNTLGILNWEIVVIVVVAVVAGVVATIGSSLVGVR